MTFDRFDQLEAYVRSAAICRTKIADMKLKNRTRTRWTLSASAATTFRWKPDRTLGDVLSMGCGLCRALGSGRVTMRDFLNVAYDLGVPIEHLNYVACGVFGKRGWKDVDRRADATLDQ